MNIEQVQNLRLEDIYPNPENRRVGGFNPVKLQELADSIRDIGVQQPIIVRIREGLLVNDVYIENTQIIMYMYDLVAGERRWRASKLAGKTTIPAVVRDLTDIQILKIQTVENLMREDVHPLDEADGFARLIDKAGYGVDQISAELGKSASYVYQRLKLRELIDEARKLFEENMITAGHAILIARLAPDQQKLIIAEGLFEGWKDDGSVVSVRDLGDWIEQNIMMELSKVTWKLDDAELVPAAGSCRECPKRTGYQPQLFADVCNTKRDYCTDGSCFASKKEAIVERRREELKDEPHLEVADGYAGSNPAKNIIQNWQWEECKKSDSGAQRALVVAGDTPGRLTYGIVRKSSNSSYQPTEKEKKAEQKRKLEEKIITTIRRRLYDLIIVKAKEEKAEPGYKTEVLRMIAYSFWGRLWDNHHRLLIKIEGGKAEKYSNQKWGENLIEKMERDELSLFLIKCSLLTDMDCNNYDPRYFKMEKLQTAAEQYGIDIEAIIKVETEKIKEKEKKSSGAKKKGMIKT